MRTCLSEIFPARRGERAVHVLHQSHRDEEEEFELLGVAERLLLRQLKGIPLIIGPDYDRLTIVKTQILRRFLWTAGDAGVSSS